MLWEKIAYFIISLLLFHIPHSHKKVNIIHLQVLLPTQVAYWTVTRCCMVKFLNKLLKNYQQDTQKHHKRC